MSREAVSDGPLDCNSTALRMASRRVAQLYDATLAPCGLRSTQRAIIACVEHRGMPSVGQLAAALVLDRGALAHSLKPLERDGLVRVVVDRDDRRTRLVVLTGAGRAKLAESQELWREAQRRFETAFDAKGLDALRDSLRAIASVEFETSYRAAD